jgi:hypothetical protein
MPNLWPPNAAEVSSLSSDVAGHASLGIHSLNCPCQLTELSRGLVPDGLPATLRAEDLDSTHHKSITTPIQVCYDLAVASTAIGVTQSPERAAHHHGALIRVETSGDPEVTWHARQKLPPPRANIELAPIPISPAVNHFIIRCLSACVGTGHMQKLAYALRAC